MVVGLELRAKPAVSLEPTSGGKYKAYGAKINEAQDLTPVYRMHPFDTKVLVYFVRGRASMTSTETLIAPSPLSVHKAFKVLRTAMDYMDDNALYTCTPSLEILKHRCFMLNTTPDLR